MTAEIAALADFAGAAVDSDDDLVIIGQGGGLRIGGRILAREALPELAGRIGADAEIAAAVAPIAPSELGLVAAGKHGGDEQQR